MQHEIDVNAFGDIVWVNSGIDGSCIGRFSKKHGMDVHRTGTEQLAGKGECLYCTHSPGTQEDWAHFVELMKRHYNIDVPINAITFEE